VDRNKFNKVLNRPLFRNAALKKGDLKPIRAQVGIMVGQPVGGSTAYNPNRVPVTIPGQGPYTPQGPGMFQKGLGYVAKGAEYLDVTSPKFYRGVGNLGTDVIAQQGLYNLGKGAGLGETTSTIGSLAGLFNPVTRGAGVISGLGSLANKYILDGKLNRDTNTYETRFGNVSNFMPQSYYALKDIREKEAQRKLAADKERQIQQLTSLDTNQNYEMSMGEDYFSGYGLSEEENVRNMSNEQKIKKAQKEAQDLSKLTGISTTKAGNILLSVYNGVQNPADAQRAVQDDGFYAQNTPNFFKDPKIAPISQQKTVEMSEGAIKPKKEEPKKLGDGKGVATTTGVPKKQTTVNGQVYTTDMITRARQIAEQLREGRSPSNANLVFLAQLASGLMSGTTTKSGLGGALEVFGNALNPAVSNYAVMKLKENEIENKLMGDALDAAAAEMSALAKGAKMIDANVEHVQLADKDGNLYNYEGRRLKNGTVQIKTPGGYVGIDEASEALGKQGLNYVQSLPAANAFNENTMKLRRKLSQETKSLNILNDAVSIITTKKGAAGVGGKLNLIKSRLGSAAESLGFGGDYEALSSKADTYTKDFFGAIDRGLEDGYFTKERANELKKKYNYDSLKEKAKKRFKTTFAAEGEKVTDEELEKLAVAEVTLTYALANSFKDSDRLTGRDVDAADKVVGIFPIFGGDKTVLSKLKALEDNLITDLNDTKRRLREAGVLETFMSTFEQQLRYNPKAKERLYEQYKKSLKEDSQEDLIKKFNKGI